MDNKYWTSPGAPYKQQPRKLNILICEDNVDMLQVLTLTLERMGHRVDAVTNVDDALKTFRIYHDLVITDGDLGNCMTGINLLSYIQDVRAVPIFMHTGDEILGQAFLKAGGHRFIHKLDFGAMPKAINEFFEIRAIK